MHPPPRKLAAALTIGALLATRPALAAEPDASDGATEEPAADPPPDADKWKPKKPKLEGYLQVHFRYSLATAHDGSVDASDFRVQRARIGVEGLALPKIGYDLEIDPRAPEITGVMRDAYITFLHLPDHEIRLGQQKTWFGYENLESSTHLYAVNRTEVSDNLSRGRNLRDVGIGLVGKVPLSDALAIEDGITLVNGAGMNVQEDDTPRKNLWGRVGLRAGGDETTLRAGTSGGVGDFIDEGDAPLDPADDFRIGFQRFGGDLEFVFPYLSASAEYVGGIDEIGGTAEFSNGYYLNLVGRTPWKVGPIARYDAMDDDFERYTFGAYWGEEKARFRVMLNYEYRRVMDGVRGDDKAYVWTQVRI